MALTGPVDRRGSEDDNEPSVLALALRVLRGELTEAQAIEILRRSGEVGPADG